MPRGPWAALLVALLDAGCASTSTPKPPAAARGDTTMQAVKSLDGTPIAYTRTGHGPPLVLVHGTSADHARCASLLPRLEDRFTVYTLTAGAGPLGGDSPAFFGAATENVHRALPNSRVVMLPGQQHAAMNTAPELFLREVLALLAE